MAIDAYLQIDGIRGESADNAHPGWIELTAAHMGVTQPRATTVSTAGGHTVGHCEHRVLTFSKLAGERPDFAYGSGYARRRCIA